MGILHLMLRINPKFDGIPIPVNVVSEEMDRRNRKMDQLLYSNGIVYIKIMTS